MCNRNVVLSHMVFLKLWISEKMKEMLLSLNQIREKEKKKEANYLLISIIIIIYNRKKNINKIK